MNIPEFRLGDRLVGGAHPPLVLAEIGINHEGSIDKAIQLVDDAVAVGCECVKFQCHDVEDEMIPNDVVPGNATESIWEIMSRCALSEAEDQRLIDYCRSKKVLYLSTPFSRAAAERLERLGVVAYKIGSGECNNYPLVEHIARYGKPVILSTGMNSLASIARSVAILREQRIPYALMHCTSIYPTPYDKIRLGGLADLARVFGDAVLGLSDHSLSNYPCLAAVACGASLLERHFVSDKSWPGPDVPISMDPGELRELIAGSRIIHQCLGGRKEVLAEEQPTIDFAYATVVSIRSIKAGETLTRDNLWVKRPGTGEILAAEYDQLLGKRAAVDIADRQQIRRAWVVD